MQVCVEALPVGGHFWHWFVGEFIFSISKALEVNATKLVMYSPIRKWGEFPLDRFYKDVEGPDFTVELTNEYPVGGNRHRVSSADGWDRSYTKWTPMIRRSIRGVVTWLSDRVRRARDIPHIPFIVQLRKDDKHLANYYKNADTPCARYGSNRRNVQDLHRACEMLARRGVKAECVHGDGEHLYDQIAPYLNATHLILCHGAGMAWVLFMRPGPKVIELRSPKGLWSSTIKKIARTNGKGECIQIQGKQASFEEVRPELATILDEFIGDNP